MAATTLCTAALAKTFFSRRARAVLVRSRRSVRLGCFFFFPLPFLLDLDEPRSTPVAASTSFRNSGSCQSGCACCRWSCCLCSRALSSGLRGCPLSSLGMIFPWNGHFSRSWRSQSLPLGLRARHLCCTGSNVPEKVMCRLWSISETWALSTSSSTSLGFQKRCWESDLQGAPETLKVAPLD